MTTEPGNKFKKVQLGTRRNPLPAWDRKTAKGGALIGAKGALTFYTMRDDMSRSGAAAPVSDDDRIAVEERIYAELMRNYPSRNMTEFLIHELQARDPHRIDWERNSFVSGYVGGPGVGKSFLFKLLGSLVHPKGSLYMNVKGVDVGSIFSETVFETSGAMQERAAIDAKILQGNNGGKGLKAESVEILRSVLGEAFVEAAPDGKPALSIQWDNMRVSGGTVQQQAYQGEVIAQALRQVCTLEGIKLSEGGIQIGITTRDGIAIRAMDPNSADYGRPILLDELNANPDDQGSLEKLFEYIAFLADPKVPSIELAGGKNRKMTFHRRELPPTFRLNFTANPNARGMARGSFDRALTSRFGVQLDLRTVPDQDATDYADRIAAYLVGAPLMQVYSAGVDPSTGANIYDSNPEYLKAALLRVQTLARTDAEAAHAARSSDEALNVEIAPRIMQMATQMGNFFERLGDMLSPDSPLHKNNGLNISPEYEAYLREVQIDLRLPTKLIEKAGAVEPQAETPADFNDLAKAFAGAFSGADEDDDSADFGDLLADRGKRLESFIVDWLKQVIVPGDAGTRGIATSEARQLLNLVLREAADNGIGARELNESGRGGIASLSSLYDLDRMENPDEQARIVRATLLGAAEGLAGAKADNVMTITEMRRLSRATAGMKTGTGRVVIARTDADGLAESPFTLGRLVDSIDPKVRNDDLPQVGDLATYEGLMIPVAWKEIGAKTLSEVWGTAARRPAGKKSLAMQVAENDAEAGIGVISLLVRKGNAPEIVHVLQGAGDTLVVSGGISKDFGALLKKQGIKHVDYNSSSAPAAIDAHVSAAGIDSDMIAAIKSAFLLRNGEQARRQKDMKRTLGEMMSDVTGVPPVAPVFVAVNSSAPKAVKRKRS